MAQTYQIIVRIVLGSITVLPLNDHATNIAEEIIYLTALELVSW